MPLHARGADTSLGAWSQVWGLVNGHWRCGETTCGIAEGQIGEHVRQRHMPAPVTHRTTSPPVTPPRHRPGTTLRMPAGELAWRSPLADVGVSLAATARPARPPSACSSARAWRCCLCAARLQVSADSRWLPENATKHECSWFAWVRGPVSHVVDPLREDLDLGFRELGLAFVEAEAPHVR